jgi:hypothetical protein
MRRFQAKSAASGGLRLLILCGEKVHGGSHRPLLFKQPVRRKYFDGSGFPHHFYGPEEYSRWLTEAGLNPLRVELAPKAVNRKAAHDNSLQLV